MVDRTSTVEQISVTVGGYNALHNIGASMLILDLGIFPVFYSYTFAIKVISAQR